MLKNISKTGFILGWDETFQQEIDNILINIFETYFSDLTSGSTEMECIEKTDTNIDMWGNDHVVSKFMEFCLLLIKIGRPPEIADILIQSAYDTVIASKRDDNISQLSVQLLLIKKICKLLHEGDFQECNFLIMEFTSPMNKELYKYTPILKQRWNESVRYVPGREYWD